MKTTCDKAIEIAKLIKDGKGNDVKVIDVSKLNSWTDFFVLVTVNSSTQYQGFYRQIKDYIKDNDLEIRLTNRKLPDTDDWNLMDLGSIVIHFMSDNARKFYDLEKLWHKGTFIEVE